MKAKILVIGPQKSGKSVLTNFLADTLTEAPKSGYRATQGVRIVEFESRRNVTAKQIETTPVELWDMSGSRRAGQLLSDQVTVYNPAEQSQEELDFWVKNVIKASGLRSSQCILFVNHFDGAVPDDSVQPTKALSKVKRVNINMDADGDSLRSEFQAFVSSLRAGIQEGDRDEMGVII